MGGLVVVLRIKGNIGMHPDIKKTLESLKLRKVFTAALYPLTPELEGMLKKVQRYVTWGKPNRETIFTFLKRSKYVAEEGLERLADALEKGEEELSRPLFINLRPPSKGFKNSLKKDFKSGGEYGDRGEKINDLIRRMF